MSKGDVVAFDVGKYGMIARRSGSTIIINYEGAEYQRPEKDHEVVLHKNDANYFESLALCLPDMFLLKTGVDKFLTVYLNRTNMQRGMSQIPKITPVDSYSRTYMKSALRDISRSRSTHKYLKVLVIAHSTAEATISRIMHSRKPCIIIYPGYDTPYYNISSVCPSEVCITHTHNKFFFSCKTRPNEIQRDVIAGLACLRPDTLVPRMSTLNIPKM